MQGVLKNLLLLSVVALLASGCAGMKKKGGGGGGGAPPGGGEGGGGKGQNQQADRDRQEIQRLIDQRDEVQRQLDDELASRNNPNNAFVQNGIANGNIDQNRDALPGGINAGDPNVFSGNAFESGRNATPIDPNGAPPVLEAGVDPLIAVGNPNTAGLRSSATRQQTPTRGLASHN